MIAILANYSCLEISGGGPQERDFFLQLVYVGLIHFCNMSALNYFVKSTIATVSALIVVVLLSPLVCDTTHHYTNNNLQGFQTGVRQHNVINQGIYFWTPGPTLGQCYETSRIFMGNERIDCEWRKSAVSFRYRYVFLAPQPSSKSPPSQKVKKRTFFRENDPIKSDTTSHYRKVPQLIGSVTCELANSPKTIHRSP